MSDANTSAPAETGDLDLSALAASLPDDAFDLPEDSETEHPEGGEAASAEPAAEAEGDEPDTPPETNEETVPAEPEAAETTSEGPQTVVIGGKAIPLEEVERGYQRQADYTRKTQEVADERRALGAERDTLTTVRTQLDTDRNTLAALFDIATDFVKARLPQEPDPALADTDVVAYIQQQRDHRAGMAEFSRLIEARKALDAGKTRERETTEAEARKTEAAARKAEEAAYAEEVHLARTKIPEFKTADGAKTFFMKAETYAAHHGVKPEEVHGLRDHRMLLILSDAMKWRELQDKKPAALERAKAAPPIRTAARQPAGTRSADQVRAARERLSREGSIEAAADMLDDSLFD